MIREGVKLYAEADTYQRTISCLESWCFPPNDSAVITAKHCLISCARALLMHYKKEIHARPQSAMLQNQARTNLTITQMKEDYTRFTHRLGRRLKKKVWRGK